MESFAHIIETGSIFDTLKTEKFYQLEPDDACINDNELSPVAKPISSVIKNNNIMQINKILEVYFLSKIEPINEYHDINAYEHFNSDFMI